MLLLVLLLSTLSICSSSPIGVVSIFRPDESLYLKYAAVLATTEPLRLDCDREIRKSVNPLVLFWESLKGSHLCIFIFDYRTM